jgi:hypothetical protein
MLSKYSALVLMFDPAVVGHLPPKLNFVRLPSATQRRRNHLPPYFKRSHRYRFPLQPFVENSRLADPGVGFEFDAKSRPLA